MAEGVRIENEEIQDREEMEASFPVPPLCLPCEGQNKCDVKLVSALYQVVHV